MKRRTFVQKVGTGAAALQFVPLVLSGREPEKVDEMLNI